MHQLNSICYGVADYSCTTAVHVHTIKLCLYSETSSYIYTSLQLVLS